MGQLNESNMGILVIENSCPNKIIFGRLQIKTFQRINELTEEEFKCETGELKH